MAIKSKLLEIRRPARDGMEVVSENGKSCILEVVERTVDGLAPGSSFLAGTDSMFVSGRLRESIGGFVHGGLRDAKILEIGKTVWKNLTKQIWDLSIASKWNHEPRELIEDWGETQNILHMCLTKRSRSVQVSKLNGTER